MEITEVRVKLVHGKNDKLRAFCSITLDDDFVVRDLKVIEGTKGPFVAMPSRKIMQRCGRCSGKNHYRARFCNDCGAAQKAPRSRDEQDEGHERSRNHAEIAHPINSRCRERIQKRVLERYEEELECSRSPDYEAPSFEYESDEELAYFSDAGRGASPTRAAERLSDRGAAERPAPDREPEAPTSPRPAFDEPRAPRSPSAASSRSARPEIDRSRSGPLEGETQPVEKERRREDDLEPEDNFGAGILG